MDGGPNEKVSFKPKTRLIEFSSKNCKMTAYSQVDQTIAPVPDYCSVRHRCILGNLAFVSLLVPDKHPATNQSPRNFAIMGAMLSRHQCRCRGIVFDFFFRQLVRYEIIYADEVLQHTIKLLI